MGEQVLAGRMSPTITEPSPVQQNVSAAHDRLSGAVASLCSERYPHEWRVTKDARHGWQADGDVKLRDGLVLTVYTRKSLSGDLRSTATVYEVGDGFRTHIMYQDFSEIVLRSNERCTEKNVRAQHEAALAIVLDRCLPLVIQQYHLED